MGQEVKNLFRAQSKYGLMGSSAKTGKKISTGHRSSFWIKLSFGIGHPQLYINCSVYVWGAQGFQIFKRNSIISICSKVMAFLAILLSPLSLHRPSGPRIIPVIPVSSPLSPCCSHSPQKVSMGSPLSPPMLSPSSPRCPCCTHIILIIPTSSRRSPNHSQPPR